MEAALREIRSPYDGRVVARLEVPSPEICRGALKAAFETASVLAELTTMERRDRLAAVAAGIESEAEALARTIVGEAGKTIRLARAEVARAATTFRVAAAETLTRSGELVPLDLSAAAAGRLGLVRRVPVGVVLGITPFNFPLNLVAHKVAPALAVGCPVLLKPASQTPLSALHLAQIAARAGFVEGAFQVVAVGAAAAQALLVEPEVAKLSFTGSAEVGWRLKGLVPKKKVTLELGGNAAAVVCEDVSDLEAAAARCAAGAFAFSGQVCISLQRVFVQRSIAAPFLEALAGRARQLVLGDPAAEATDLGPLIDDAAAARLEDWIAEAKERGAEVVCGGGRHGRLFEPTVLTGVPPDCAIASQEAFGPVVVVEPYDDFADAVAAVNRGRYGLQAAVFTQRLERVAWAWRTMAVGAVVVNDAPTFRMDNMPYGGVKDSGFGREGVRWAMDEMTEPRLLAVNWQLERER